MNLRLAWRQDVGEVLRPIAAVVLGLVSASLHVAYASPLAPVLLDVVLYGLAACSGRFRRLAALSLVVCSAWLLIVPDGWASMGEYALLIPVVGVFRDRQRVVWIGYSLVAISLLVGTSVGEAGWGAAVPSALLWLALFGIAWAVNGALDAAAQRQQLLHDKALTIQRQGIARDLHDTVAHGLSLMVMRAEQSRLKGDVSQEDLAFIIEQGDRAIRELRAMLRLMRGPEGAAGVPVTAWRIESLADVLAECRADLQARGFAVSLSVEGELGKVPPRVSDALAKMTREATANIAKHGLAAKGCAILVSVEDAEVELAFVNEPNPRAGMSSEEPLGLVGMRERAESIGGRVSVAMGAAQWMARVTVPLAGSAGALVKEQL